MIRKIHLVAAATAAVLCAACDTHIDVPDTAVRPGHILCEDGTALPYAQYEQSGKKAIAVVFDTEKRGDTEGDGYAVYLWDIAPQAFADSLGIAQGTSADIMAYDGNENTFALYDTQETASPMAEAVFDLWRYGQSAYVPSVAEMRLLYTMRKIINLSSNNVAVSRYHWMKTTVGTGHPQKSKSNRQPRHGSIPWGAVQCRKHLKYRRTEYAP